MVRRRAEQCNGTVAGPATATADTTTAAAAVTVVTVGAVCAVCARAVTACIVVCAATVRAVDAYAATVCAATVCASSIWTTIICPATDPGDGGASQRPPRRLRSKAATAAPTSGGAGVFPRLLDQVGLLGQRRTSRV